MRENSESSVACHHRVGFLGLLITLGIVFGDIGKSPLYVMKAILNIMMKQIEKSPLTIRVLLGIGKLVELIR